MAKLIKSAEDYQRALAEVDRLVERDPEPGTVDADRLELLAVLLRDYEARRLTPRAPDPLEAIRFRMEQGNLAQRDLIPYIGSRSKVSEVLSGKRPLTLTMIRALHHGLGIPAESLLHDPTRELLEASDVEWGRFPVREMIKRGWIEGITPDQRCPAEEVMRRFLRPLGGQLAVSALYMTSKVRSGRAIDKHALVAWTLRVGIRAWRADVAGAFTVGMLTDDFMREVARLSWSSQGPRLAQEFLQRHGIALVIERHLTHTHLDGAAVLVHAGRPAIGLTIRHNRLDNFWYALMHELAHVRLHLRTVGDTFCDDLDVEDRDDPREREADDLAREILVPSSAWRESPARVVRSPEAAKQLATRLRVHPAVVAGRMRYEAKNYKILGPLIGSGEVRKVFTEIDWPD